jgi:release factor glutamine methyltransferase
MSTFRELLSNAQKLLRQKGICDADIDAWYLLEYVFGINRARYFIQADWQAPDEAAVEYMRLIEKRAMHVPLQHITGIQEFMGLEFEVNEDVLIPRQDTELLVEEVLKVCTQKSVLDMCSGSGCIIISLAKLGGLKKAVGADISDKALRIAKRNADKHGVNVEFLYSNLFDNINESFDIIVSNPPYIPTADIELLMPEVKTHEPMLALDGMEDGLEFYRRLAAVSGRYLNKPGSIYVEIGYDQAEAVKQLFAAAGFCDLVVIKDLSGHDRVVSANWL